MLITVHHLILIIEKNFLKLGEGPTDGITDSISAAEKILVLTLVKQWENFV